MPFMVTQNWGFAPIGVDGNKELFDLQKDPYALHNLAGDHPSVVAELHEMFRKYLDTHRATKSFVDLFDSDR